MPEVGLLRTESAELVEAVLDEICEAIVRGEAVKLSSFATFHVRDKNERVGRNPKTGEEVPILPRRVMTFKASQVMKGRIVRSHRISKGWTDPAYGSEQTKRTSVPRAGGETGASEPATPASLRHISDHLTQA